MTSGPNRLPAAPSDGADSAAVTLRTRAGTAIALLLVIALAAGLRLFHLGRPSLWNDELFSRYYGELFGLRFLWGKGLRLEPTPPLYYTLLEGWIGLFGDSATALRMVSVLAGCAAVPLVYALGRAFAGRWQALTAALLFALSPMAIYFSEEARAYALLLLPAGLVLLAVARFLREPAAAGPLVLYGLAGVVGIYCHPTFPILLASCNIVVLWYLLASGAAGRSRAVVAWLAVNAGVALIGLPEAAAMVSGASQGAVDWLPSLRPRDVAVALSQLVSGVVTDPLVPGAPLAAALLLVLAGSLWASPPDRRELAVVILIPLVFLALAVLVSVDRMILLPRILCWMTIPLSLALARGLFAAARLRLLLGGLTAVTLAVGLVWQLGFADGAKEPWRDVLGAVGPKLARADLVVLGPSTDPVVLAYYAPQVQAARMWADDGPPNIENSDMRERLNVGRISLDDIVRAIAAGRSVWVVANYVDQPSLPALLERTPPPTRRIDRHCGKYECVTVLGWSAARNRPPRSP